ncbi:MAG: GNAT family N-acetyltransferase [Betaproteobacteria bacterium]|nr:GNAT family N-acetyltransferase [Betaproteobacteria bacterium]
MATIRALTDDDLAGVAGLFARIYPDYGWSSPADCERYFREMLFEHPWGELELPSWVAEEGGRIVGLYAVQPRRMLFDGRPLRVAVGCQYMVDPAFRQGGMTALQLAKVCLSGPQDLTIADGANEDSMRIWSAISGSVPLLNSLYWTRPLRPAHYALALLEARTGSPNALTCTARPFAALLDALAARAGPNRFLREAGDLTEEPLDAQTMLAHLPAVLRGYAVQPVYDERSLDWLLAQAARKTLHGELRARAVRDRAHRLAGWYLHYVRAGGVSEVLQIAALEGSFDRVLTRLLADAWRQGALAVHGRLEPRFARELSARHAWLRTDGPWTLAHSRHAEIMRAIHEGAAFLSRLDGEWWQRWRLRLPEAPA